jgi:hypothetical protein
MLQDPAHFVVFILWDCSQIISTQAIILRIAMGYGWDKKTMLELMTKSTNIQFATVKSGHQRMHISSEDNAHEGSCTDNAEKSADETHGGTSPDETRSMGSFNSSGYGQSSREVVNAVV